MATGLPIELEQEYQRNKELRNYFKIPANQAKVDLDLPLKDRQTSFEAHLQEFENLLPGKEVITTGITSGKKVLKSDVAKLFAPICKRTFSYANKYSKFDLKANMNFSKRKILNMADGDVFPFAEATQQKITIEAVPDPQYAPYNITPAMLAAAMLKAKAFRDSIGEAGSVVAGTHAVVVALENKNLEIHTDVDDYTDLMTSYEDNDPDFFNGFLAAKVVNDIGLHHSGIEGTVTGPDGNPLKDVTVECVQNDKKKDKTDVVGHYEIKNFIPDNYEFKFTHAVHGEKIIVVKIERGKVKTVDVQMGV